MLSFIEGLVLLKDKNILTIKTNSGIAFDIYVKTELSKKLKEDDTVALYSFLNIGENKLELYGFENLDEKRFFELLVSVSGVGPKSALHILELDKLEKIKSAILKEDLEYLSQVSGIGKKTAKKIIFELSDKIDKVSSEEILDNGKDVIDALVALGFSVKEARDAVKNINADLESESDKIKEAIKYLSNKK